jgi:hypothetical protein
MVNIFGKEPNGTGRAIFAINFRIFALEAFLTHADLVLHTHIRCLSVRMFFTFVHWKPFLDAVSELF